jgi:hypothetical protein
VTGGVIWFAFFGFQRHSEGSFEAGTCCPFISDASAKIWTLQGFLKIQQTSLLKGYWVCSEHNKDGLIVDEADLRVSSRGCEANTMCLVVPLLRKI